MQILQNKLVQFMLAAGVVMFIVTDPLNAAELTKQIGGFIGMVFEGFTTFLSALAKE